MRERKAGVPKACLSIECTYDKRSGFGRRWAELLTKGRGDGPDMPEEEALASSSIDPPSRRSMASPISARVSTHARAPN